MITEEFKRLNYFKGFFIQAEDCQSGEEYHIEKRKFHNTFLHTPGIAYGCLDNLKVTASADRFDSSIFIGAGYAIDGEGHDLYLPKLEQLKVVPEKYSPPATIYVTIRYYDEPINERINTANPEYTGCAFIKEKPVIEITKDEPDNNNVIELARIRLTKSARKITNPEDPDKPCDNEIDTTHVKKAGAVKSLTKLEDISDKKKVGSINVPPSSDSIPHDIDPNVRIEKVNIEEGNELAAAHRFYLVSAFPKKWDKDEESKEGDSKEAERITWRIESSYVDGAIEYRLFFKNYSEIEATVHYQICRLRQ